MREQEIKLTNVKKSCNSARLVAKVLGIIMTVLSIIMVLGGVVVMFLKNQVNGSLSVQNANDMSAAIVIDEVGKEIFSVEEFNQLGKFGFFGFMNMPKILVSQGKIAEAICWLFFTAAISIAISAAVFFLIMNLFKLIKNSETPFDQQVMKKIKTLFIVLTVMALLYIGLGVAVLTGVVFWSIYCVMDYGFVLQKEADETL